MYLIPQPKNIEFGEPGSHFTLSYGSYVVLEPCCGEKLTAQAKLAVEALKEELGFAPALTQGDGPSGRCDFVAVGGDGASKLPAHCG